MADIFISYSRPQADIVADLANHLRSLGFTVWWDTSLIAGNRFADVVAKEIDKARAVIVIWSSESAASDWVRWEASRANSRRVLIPLCMPQMPVDNIPAPFGVLHTEAVTNRAAITDGLKALGVEPGLIISSMNDPSSHLATGGKAPSAGALLVTGPFWIRSIASVPLRWIASLILIAGIGIAVFVINRSSSDGAHELLCGKLTRETCDEMSRTPLPHITP